MKFIVNIKNCKKNLTEFKNLPKQKLKNCKKNLTLFEKPSFAPKNKICYNQIERENLDMSKQITPKKTILLPLFPLKNLISRKKQ